MVYNITYLSTLQNLNFYAALEEAVTIYANELYGFKIRDNYFKNKGKSNSNLGIISDQAAKIQKRTLKFSFKNNKNKHLCKNDHTSAAKACIHQRDTDGMPPSSARRVGKLGQHVLHELLYTVVDVFCDSIEGNR